MNFEPEADLFTPVNESAQQIPAPVDELPEKEPCAGQAGKAE